MEERHEDMKTSSLYKYGTLDYHLAYCKDIASPLDIPVFFHQVHTITEKSIHLACLPVSQLVSC